MTVKVRNLQRKPFSPIGASSLRSSNSIVLLPPSNAVAVANSQSITSLASNALATSARGLTNPVLLNGSGIFAVLDPNSIDFGVYFPIPVCPVITISNGASTFTVRWRGVNHLGRPIQITESKTHTSAVLAPTFFQSQACFSYLDSCEILSYSGAGAETLTIGYVWDFGAGGTSAYHKRIPMPYELQATGQSVGMNLVELGGAVWAGVTAWIAGDLISNTVGNDSSGYGMNPALGTTLFNMGRTSTNPTTPFRVICNQLPYAKNTYFQDSVPAIVA